jgi:putative ABC transport system substrate-binding protein
MEELVSRKVDLIVASNAPAASAAARATRTIPIVLAGVNDPVGLGIAASLEHSGRNVTGTTIYAPDLIVERLRILKRIAPGTDRVAIFMNGNNRNNPAQVTRLVDAGKGLGIRVDSIDIRSPNDVAPGVAKAVASGAKAFFNCVDSFINSQRFSIGKLTREAKRPTVMTDREYVLAGGLMALGVGHTEGFYRSAEYAHKVLRGANPADLPIALPTERALSVSRSALNDIGVTLPGEIADQVTEWLP